MPFYSSKSLSGCLSSYLAEGVQPDYVSSIHYVSSLGTGKTAQFYNLSTILLGVCVTLSSIMIRRFNSSRVFFALFLIAGLATIGVGVFPEDSRPMHGIVTPIALIFGALAAMFSYKLQKKPAAYFCVILARFPWSLGYGLFRI